jgi:hypothetical protein
MSLFKQRSAQDASHWKQDGPRHSLGFRWLFELETEMGNNGKPACKSCLAPRKLPKGMSPPRIVTHHKLLCFSWQSHEKNAELSTARR